VLGGARVGVLVVAGELAGLDFLSGRKIYTKGRRHWREGGRQEGYLSECVPARQGISWVRVEESN
jgi:hypothetical protein